MSYTFAILDPRNLPGAVEANDKIFASGPVYGIEVTVPVLAARCWENLDPQHSGGNADSTAIEEAFTAELPGNGVVFATVRADLDSIGAMAIFSIRWGCGPHGWASKPVMDRIDLVAHADKFARGKWVPRQLPTREMPWDDSSASAESSRPLAAIAAAVADFKVPLADRVAAMEKWLLSGEEPKQYRDSVEKERLDMIAALESGAIKYETYLDGKIAFVQSTHRAATSIGYALAPVVVAFNPALKQGPGDPYKKFTVCQFEPGYVDLGMVKTELSLLERGWGGSPTIIGSPQGVSSELNSHEVIRTVAKYLK
ncbi:MAG: hypothetical protein Q7S84_04815 [bacterium]|nr:hypothetical protein [bacterium]